MRGEPPSRHNEKGAARRTKQEHLNRGAREREREQPQGNRERTAARRRIMKSNKNE